MNRFLWGYNSYKEASAVFFHFFFVEHRFTEGVTWHVVDKSHQDSSPLGAGVTVILSPVLKRCWKRFSRKGCTTFKRRKTDRSKIQVAFF